MRLPCPVQPESRQSIKRPGLSTRLFHSFTLVPSLLQLASSLASRLAAGGPQLVWGAFVRPLRLACACPTRILETWAACGERPLFGPSAINCLGPPPSLVGLNFLLQRRAVDLGRHQIGCSAAAVRVWPREKAQKRAPKRPFTGPRAAQMDGKRLERAPKAQSSRPKGALLHFVPPPLPKLRPFAAQTKCSQLIASWLHSPRACQQQTVAPPC